jgi:hypothetical protein
VKETKRWPGTLFLPGTGEAEKRAGENGENFTVKQNRP